MNKSLLKIISSNEQDRSHAEQWWKESSMEEKLIIFMRTNRHYKDYADEIMSLLAQLAFCELYEKFPIEEGPCTSK